MTHNVDECGFEALPELFVRATVAAQAGNMLARLVDREQDGLTPEHAVALAEMLCHVAGGDGRGVFAVVHRVHRGALADAPQTLKGR